MKRNICYKLAVIFFALVFIILFSVNRTNAIYRETKTATINLNIVEGNIICRKATTLNTETCSNPDTSKGCRASGYDAGETITYGNIIRSDTLAAGDALDCNVDGTGYNKRFYYLRTLNDNAVLIYDHSFEGDLGATEANSSQQHFLYDTALTKIPTTTQWSNLPVTFEIQEGDNRPARFPTLADLEAATGKNSYNQLHQTGSLDNYNFIFENLSYAYPDGRSTVWLQMENETLYRAHKDGRNVATVQSTSYNTVRPVIEVPLSMIEDTYVIGFDANGGTVANEYITIQKGSRIGTLPTPTKANSAFMGWYTDTSWSTQIDANTIPNGYNTYYAKWIIPVEEAELEHDLYNLIPNETVNIVIYNNSVLEAHSFDSSDTSVATVDYNGLITAVGEGTATITITGTETNTTKTITVNVINNITEYRVIFDSQAGTAVADMYVPVNTAIGTLPTTVRTNYDFAGWYTDTTWATQVTEQTIITENNLTFYAKWIPSSAIVEMNGEYYDTIQAAIIASTNDQTTINVIKDVTITGNHVNSSSNGKFWANFYDNDYKNKNMVVDLQGHTITNTTNDTYVLRSRANVELKNGTIINTANGKGAVESDSKTLKIKDMTITVTGNRQAVFNEGGTIEIENSTISAVADGSGATGDYRRRATVQTKTGTTYIKSGNISANSTSTTAIAVSVQDGTVVLGTENSVYDTSILTLESNNYGIFAEHNISIYDGMIKGKTAAINDESMITAIETYSVIVNDTDNGYYRLYYNIPDGPANIRIDLDPAGGEVSPTYIVMDLGDQVGTLPTPTRGIYTFEGWYDENDVLVTSDREPETDEEYHAVWSYTPSNEIIDYNPNNSAIQTYYSNIASWQSSSTNFPSWNSNNKSPNWSLDATENTVMMQNFVANNCKCEDNQCSSAGTVACDKPVGFDTGTGEQVNVYLSDSSRTKGAQVDYAKGSNGVIYNLIPDQIYLWELDSDPTNVYGYVRSIGERRIVEAGDVRNVRDLGGMPVDSDGDGMVDGQLAYGRLVRGIKLESNSSVTELVNLGITEQFDLRSSSDANSSAYKLSSVSGKKFHQIEAQNYFIDPNGATQTEREYYQWTRNAVTYAMQEVVAGENVYFHCRLGADRTGSVAYMLEGLLGVPEEDRIQDYELSFFYGLVRVHRYHNEKPGSNIGTGKERFVYMHNLWDTNDKIYQWYMAGSTNVASDEQLINDFRTAMIISN